MNTYGSQGMTNLKIIDFLSQYGFSIDGEINFNAKNIYDWTPLHSASRNGRLDIVKYLVQNGVDVNCSDNDKWTPLHLASRYGHLDVIKYLVENGAIIDSIDNDKWTSLHLASRYEHLDVVKYLVENGADINFRNNKGRKPIDVTKTDEIIDYLSSAHQMVDNKQFMSTFLSLFCN